MCEQTGAKETIDTLQHTGCEVVSCALEGVRDRDGDEHTRHRQEHACGECHHPVPGQAGGQRIEAQHLLGRLQSDHDDH